jgi:hypothetical protein
MAMDKEEAAYDLRDILADMKDLAHRAEVAVRGQGLVEDRAHAYWLAQILCALSDEHEYLGGGSVTMQDSINELMAESEAEKQGLAAGGEEEKL